MSSAAHIACSEVNLHSFLFISLKVFNMLTGGLSEKEATPQKLVTELKVSLQIQTPVTCSFKV